MSTTDGKGDLLSSVYIIVHKTVPKMVTNWERAIKVQLINAFLPYLNDFFAT